MCFLKGKSTYKATDLKKPATDNPWGTYRNFKLIFAAKLLK
jgi:hypothetical protein